MEYRFHLYAVYMCVERGVRDQFESKITMIRMERKLLRRQCQSKWEFGLNKVVVKEMEDLSILSTKIGP